MILLGRDKYSELDIRVRVKGGGHVSQTYAIRQALAKALVAFYQKCASSAVTCARACAREFMRASGRTPAVCAFCAQAVLCGRLEQRCVLERRTPSCALTAVPCGDGAVHIFSSTCVQCPRRRWRTDSRLQRTCGAVQTWTRRAKRRSSRRCSSTTARCWCPTRDDASLRSASLAMSHALCFRFAHSETTASRIAAERRINCRPASNYRFTTPMISGSCITVCGQVKKMVKRRSGTTCRCQCRTVQ